MFATPVVLGRTGRTARMATTARWWVAAARVSGRMRRGIEVRGATATGAARVRRTTGVVMREFGMPATARATVRRAGGVVGYRTAVRATTGCRTTVILRPMPHRTTGVMRYRATMRATRWSTMRTANGAAVRATEATRRHYTMAGELPRTRSRGDTGMSVVE
jgi:hypothetical protein